MEQLDTFEEQPETKAAKDIQVGDWCAFNRLAWRVSDVGIGTTGNVLIQWGNGTTSAFHPDIHIRMHHPR